jgi:hypothetical protein
MASADTVIQQQAEVAGVASKIFGAEVRAEHVIAETLVRTTSAQPADPEALAAAVRGPPPCQVATPTTYANTRP